MPAPVYLGHGASGNADSMRPYCAALAQRGVDAFTVPASGKLPTRAEKAIDVFRAVVPDLESAVIGGHSYGGRVASMLASSDNPKGLVLFSYPLHRPGHPEELRTEHLGTIRCPVIFLSGEADGFARIDLLREAVAAMTNAELVSYPRVGHGLNRDPAAFADAIERVATFVRALG